MRQADDYSGDTSTTATAAVGGHARGSFFSEHNDTVDQDWVRVSLKANVSYRLDLDIHYAAVLQGRILGVYNSSGAKVANGRDSSRNTTWTQVTYRPTADGDYYVALSSRVQPRVASNVPKHVGAAWTMKVWSNDQSRHLGSLGRGPAGHQASPRIPAARGRGAQQRRRRHRTHPQHLGPRPLRGVARPRSPLPHQRPRYKLTG